MNKKKVDLLIAVVVIVIMISTLGYGISRYNRLDQQCKQLYGNDAKIVNLGRGGTACSKVGSPLLGAP